MHFLCMSEEPQVSPQGNYESRSDQTAKDGPVVSKPVIVSYSLSTCEESSNDALGEQSAVHGKAGVPNQANLNASERTKLGTKKGSFGVSSKAILEYMERFGDISKSNDKSLKWKELTRTLNAKTKTNWSEEQWKRKWRYLKVQCMKNKADIENGLAGGANANSASKLGYLARVLKIMKSSIVINRHEMESIETPMLTENIEKPETQVLLPEPPTHLTNVHPELSVKPVIQADGSRESGQVDREEARAVESTTYTQQTLAGPQRRRIARHRWRPTWRRNERSAQMVLKNSKARPLLEYLALKHEAVANTGTHYIWPIVPQVPGQDALMSESNHIVRNSASASKNSDSDTPMICDVSPDIVLYIKTVSSKTPQKVSKNIKGGTRKTSKTGVRKNNRLSLLIRNIFNYLRKNPKKSSLASDNLEVIPKRQEESESAMNCDVSPGTSFIKRS